VLASPAHEGYLCTRKILVPHVLRDDTIIQQQVEVYQTETMAYLLRGNENTACVSRERSNMHRSGRENCQKVGCGSTPDRSERCDAFHNYSSLFLALPCSSFAILRCIRAEHVRFLAYSAGKSPLVTGRAARLRLAALPVPLGLFLAGIARNSRGHLGIRRLFFKKTEERKRRYQEEPPGVLEEPPGKTPAALPSPRRSSWGLFLGSGRAPGGYSEPPRLLLGALPGARKSPRRLFPHTKQHPQQRNRRQGESRERRREQGRQQEQRGCQYPAGLAATPAGTETAACACACAKACASVRKSVRERARACASVRWRVGLQCSRCRRRRRRRRRRRSRACASVRERLRV